MKSRIRIYVYEVESYLKGNRWSLMASWSGTWENQVRWGQIVSSSSTTPQILYLPTTDWKYVLKNPTTSVLNICRLFLWYKKYVITTIYTVLCVRESRNDSNGRIIRVICKYHAILYKGITYQLIWMSVCGPRNNCL